MHEERADHPREGAPPAAYRAAADEDDAAAAADAEGPAEAVLTLVCLTCGWEYYVPEGGAQGGIRCEKCGSTVFREFLTPAAGDEAARDFDEVTARDLDPDDPEGDTLPGDVIDLNRV